MTFDNAAPPQGVAVSRARHGHLRWRKPRDWGFARRVDLVPIAPPDVLQVASAFALVFAGANFVPCALLRMGSQDSAYIGPDGTWIGAMIPPMLQAYPFHVTPYGEAELMLTVDESSGLLDQDPNAAPFFDANGALSPQIQEIIAFCRKHGDAARRAAPAVAQINAAGLFEPMANGIFRINQARYHALNDADFIALRRANALDLIAAHFVSMAHLRAGAPPPRQKKPLKQDSGYLQEFLAAMSQESPYPNTALSAMLAADPTP
jgi:hypothetical protein